jgi:hypothetical protein
MYHITPQLLLDSFMHMKRTAPAGVDGVTWRNCEEGTMERIGRLWDAAQSGRYRAQPSRCMYIAKGDGKQRPFGIAALEDKIVQEAVATVLTPIYEAEFLGFSYGFQPGRSQHQALVALWVGLYRKQVNWVRSSSGTDFFTMSITIRTRACICCDARVSACRSWGGISYRGRVLPACRRFFASAERFQIASRIGRWVVRRVFEVLTIHRDRCGHLAAVSSNLSGQSVGDRDFHRYVHDRTQAAYCNESEQFCASRRLAR